ncbi:MAG: hypothetical protein H7Y27_14795 [Gemmatimonadaceae bacterium]|nr:hypothetical protein [Chitinophagaceae bacterium]
MANSSTIKDELKEISPLIAGIEPVNLFKVPGGYFDGFAEGLMNKLRADTAENPVSELTVLSPLLAGLDKKLPYSAPDGYFQDLSENIVTGVKAIDFVNEELENMIPAMSGLQNRKTYTVPKGYFEAFPQKMVQLAKAQQPGKVISMNFAKRVVRYAAAAALMGVMAIGAWFYTSDKTPKGIANASAIEAETAGKVKALPDAEIAAYADVNSWGIPSASSIVADDITENNMNDLFADVSDEELQRYIEQHGGPALTTNN